MIPTDTREIDGTMFQVRGLDLRKERAVLMRLTKNLGPAIAELVRAGSAAGIPDALNRLLEHLDDDEVEYLVQVFKDVTKIGMQTGKDGEQTTQWMPYVEAAFKKGASSQLKWLWFCLEHQFAGFLGSGSGKLEKTLEDLLGRLKAKASASSSPQT